MKRTSRLDPLRAPRDARYRVQVRIIGVPYVRPVLERGSGPASVQGEIVNVFRGDEERKIGDKTTFSVDCYARPRGVSSGLLLADLEKAEFLDVILYDAPPKCRLAHSLFSRIIESPSTTPQTNQGDIQQEIERTKEKDFWEAPFNNLAILSGREKNPI